MIVKMSRYDFVLLATQSEDFIARLRDLGLVDITTLGWEPREQDRQLLTDIEQYRKAVDFLSTFAAENDSLVSSAKAYASGKEAFERYSDAMQRRVALQGESQRLRKLSEELEPWGEFSAADVAKLAQGGVVLRYFTTQSSVFDAQSAEWGNEHTVAEICRTSSSVYFVVVASADEELSFDAQEVKMPQMDYVAAREAADEADAQLQALDAEFACCAKSLEVLKAEAAALQQALQSVKIVGSAESAADGKLVVMEGWAEKDRSAEVDALLEEYPNVVYIKRDPVEEDLTPVKLKNNRFARIFELIGGLYALPKYGTLDLTPFFAPFYMLFFAICLNDAGYGAIIFLAGLALFFKGGQKMRQASLFTLFCGGATVLFGLYTGSLFGMSIPQMLGPNVSLPFLDFQKDFFTWALALGVFQIVFGMLLNICFKARYFGISTVLGSLGWFIIVLSGCLAAGLPMLIEGCEIPGFTTSSVAFYVALGIGAVLMLFLNNIHRNPIVNFATGLWDTYNNISGMLSDVLSYIRLFAIGLSGGVLAQVFNSLALGMTGLDAGIESFSVGVVVQIIAASAILLIGHGINLFMSTISSFVHPMRLTFVEFYKNAGFEMSSRQFEPLQNEEK